MFMFLIFLQTSLSSSKMGFRLMFVLSMLIIVGKLMLL